MASHVQPIRRVHSREAGHLRRRRSRAGNWTVDRQLQRQALRGRVQLRGLSSWSRRIHRRRLRHIRCMGTRNLLRQPDPALGQQRRSRPQGLHGLRSATDTLTGLIVASYYDQPEFVDLGQMLEGVLLSPRWRHYGGVSAGYSLEYQTEPGAPRLASIRTMELQLAKVTTHSQTMLPAALGHQRTRLTTSLEQQATTVTAPGPALSEE